MSRSRAVLAVAALSAAVTVVSAGAAAASPAATAATVPAHATTALAVQAAMPIAWPQVQRGSTGEPVRSLQYLLRAHGYGLVVDGVFGPRTDAALRAFQRSHGLAADGVTGPATWRAVIVTVRRGSTGDAVRAVQDEFQFRNLSGDPSRGLAVDGIFGPRTDATVRAFQSAVGLVPDGIVGPLTWNQLIGGALAG